MIKFAKLTHPIHTVRAHFIRFILGVLLICLVTSCTKLIRGELVIKIRPGINYRVHEDLAPASIMESTLEDHDPAPVRQILLSDTLWRTRLAAPLRDLASTEDDLYHWRDRHVSIQEGKASRLPNGEFVGTYEVVFREIDRQTAEKVMSALAMAYNKLEEQIRYSDPVHPSPPEVRSGKLH